MKVVLVVDKLPEKCVQILTDGGLEVRNKPGMTPDQLKEAVRGVHGVVCRSGVKITAEVLDAADSLEAVCRAGVGVDNVDLPAATKKGVVVMNTPGGNTVSTAEHAFALMMGLARNLGPAYISMRAGRWDKKSLMGSQLSGATLGVVGLGRIGQTMAKRALAFGMDVLAYDPYVTREVADKVGVELVEEFADMLPRVDYLTCHVPENDQTRGLIGAEAISRMKRTARVINCARGGVVDLAAVVQAIKEGRLGGAAFDVFEKEPPDDYSFAASDKVLATPHLGASTEEAQLAVAEEAAEQMVDALQRHHYRNAVNMPSVAPEEMKALEPYCSLASKLGALVAQLGRGRPKSIAVECKGTLAERNIQPVVDYGAVGVLSGMLGRGVNVVSAPLLAEERGVRITGSGTIGPEAGFTDLVVVRLETDAGTVEAAGTVFGRHHARIVRIGPVYVEVMPEGDLLIVHAQDVPGLIGKIGAILGEAGVNIAHMGFGREEMGGNAVLALNLDSKPADAALRKIRGMDVVREVVTVSL